MNKKILKTLALLIFLVVPLPALFALSPSIEVHENKPVGKITLEMKNLPQGHPFNQDRVLSKLRTKKGDPFSQLTFDQDLKTLSEEYDRAEPNIETKQGEIFITIQLWQKPMIQSIKWVGNDKIKTRSLQKELGIQAHSVFNRDTFNAAFNKVKDYYVKKGYFEARIEYKLIPHPQRNTVEIEILVDEGHSGHISRITFSGLSSTEESAILSMIATKKYSFFTSWLTSSGTYHEEALEHDQLIILNYLQNQGYADARVNIQTKSTPEGFLRIGIHAVKGELFHFGQLNIAGNTLLSQEQIENVITFHEQSIYSPEKLRDNIENIKDLYGKDGYIETDIHYTLHLSQSEPVYDVSINITEGEQFRIGLIRVLGNTSTNKNVILRESLLIPGEVFDSKLLKVTQMRLEAIGYFKSVNIYPVKTPEDQELGDNYRDVFIEVEETSTGNLSLFFGFSTLDDIMGGIDLAENNFDHRGLIRFWKEGMSSLRGAGEYAHLRTQIGRKQQSYTVAWMDPYFHDTLWRFGFDLNYSRSHLQSDDYSVKSYGGALFGGYPINTYWTYGWKTRLGNANIKIHNIENAEAQRERHNSGLVLGVDNSLIFDSTDNAFKPHRGFRSIMELEIGGVRRHSDDQKIFPFFRAGYLNNYYYPIWNRGTLKMRWDLKFLCPFGQGKPNLMPLNERFYLGGETTVRGYRPYILGEHFKLKEDNDKKTEEAPMGGVSSTLLSIEYLQEVFPMLDLFVFMDGGAISDKRFDFKKKLRLSYGFGARIELGNRMPIVLGYGIPINPQRKNDKKPFFISMGGQF